MTKLEKKRKIALRKVYNQRTLEDWVIILYCIYKDHNITCGPFDLWLQVVNDASQLGETIRREIIRTKFPSEVNIYTQLARLFCRISAFIGRYVYDPHSIGNNDPIGKLLTKNPLDDYISGEEKYEKWLLLKYPGACPTCGNRPCICAAYRNIMENRENSEYDVFWRKNKSNFLTEKQKYHWTEDGFSQNTVKMYAANIDSWVDMFSEIYASGHIEVSLESVGFHFLEEVGEVSDGILCFDELYKYKKKLGIYSEKRINLHKIVISRAQQDPKFSKFLKEYQNDYISDKAHNLSEIALNFLLYINMTHVKEELVDVFSWMCAILNKIKATSRHWNPQGRSQSLSDALHQRYQLNDGSVGCSYCNNAICSSKCLISSTARKNIENRTKKLDHHFFS